ncbi:MAG: hypothetical protein WB709_13240 [Solirubrobacteraceae bacterium]
MLSAIRSRLTYVNVVATLVLVFAMTGGALAAKKYLITSTKQISPSVLKQLQGKAGAPGAQGAAGAQGAQGPAGPAGAAGAKGDTGAPGTPGKDGAPGTPGTPGKDGKEGVEGPEGSPWTANGVLPPEATETGTWYMHGPTGPVTEDAAIAPISFPIPLSPAAAEAMKVSVNSEAGTPCTGTVAAPTAPAGELCIYIGFTVDIESKLRFGPPNVFEGVKAEENPIVATGGEFLIHPVLEDNAAQGGSFAITAPAGS